MLREGKVKDKICRNGIKGRTFYLRIEKEDGLTFSVRISRGTYDKKCVGDTWHYRDEY